MVSSIVGIQYLRAVAALMVVLFHATPLIDPGMDLTVGARGVDVFFVISGFIIAHTTRVRNPVAAHDAAAAWRMFMIKRLIRIVPLYWLVLAVSQWQLHVRGTPMVQPWLDYLFVPHWSAEAPGLIAPAFTPGWTLNAEMFFYVLFSVGVAWPRTRWWLIALLSGLVMWGQWSTPDHVWGRFYTRSVMAGFVLGFALEWVHANRPGWLQRLPAWAGWGLMAAGLAGLQWARHDDATLVLPVCAALVVMGGLPALAPLRSRLLQTLGDASYSIYLVHLLSFSVTRKVLEVTGGLPGEGGHAWLNALICLLMACVAGVVVHHALEKPMTHALKRWWLPRGHEPRDEGPRQGSPY